MVHVRIRRQPGRSRPVDRVYFRGGCHHCRQRLSDPAGRAVLPRSLVGTARHCGGNYRGSHWLAHLEKPARRQMVKEAVL